MSRAATDWAGRQLGLKPAAKVLLWALADCHNASTGDCFPSQDYLAKAAEMARSTVNLHLDALEKMGLLSRVSEVDQRTKRQRPTRYTLNLDAGTTASEYRTRTQYVGQATQDVVPSVSEFETRPVSENHTRAVSENHTRAVSDLEAEPCPKNGESRVRNSDSNLRKGTLREEPVRAPAAAQPFDVPDRSAEQDRFPEFWAAYPRKENQTKAEAEFITAAIRVDAETIIAAARSFAVACSGQEPRFIPLAASWLRDKRWTDQREAPKPADPEKEARRKRWRRIAAEYPDPAA